MRSSPELPSRMIVVPSGTLEHVAAGRHDHGDVAGAGEDRRVRGRAALGEDHAVHQVGVQPRGLGGCQVVGDEDSLRDVDLPGGARRSARAAPGR